MTMSSGTLWNSSVTVGGGGTGTLNVSGGKWASGAYTTTSGVLGNTATGNGLMTLSGGTIGLTNLTIGNAGVGRLNIVGGSLVTDLATLGSSTSSLGAVTAYGGTWLNTGGLVVGGSGAGTLIISGSGGSAGTVIVGGTLSAGALGLVSINGGGTLRIGTGGTTGALNAASVTNHGSLIFNRSSDSSSACVVSGSGSLTKESAGGLMLSGANNYSGGTTLNAGSLTAGHVNAFGSGTVVVNSGTLDLASRAIDNRITNNGGSVINAANYIGTQTVAGVVTMSGTIGGTVNVAASGELTGSGVVFNGPVSLATGAKHSPGTSPGSQTFAGGLTYSAGSTLNWELITNSDASAGTNYDLLSVTNSGLTITSGALLNLAFSGSGSSVSWSDPFWSTNHAWTIIDASRATTSSGSFTLGAVSKDSQGRSLTSIQPSASFQVGQSGKNVVLTYTAVPQPLDVLLDVSTGTQTQTSFGYLQITGTSSLTKIGDGSLLLDQINTFTGSTSIQQGILAITNTAAISSSPLVSLASGASFDVSGLSGGYTVPNGQTLTGEGTVLGSVTFGRGSTLSPGTFSSASGASMLAADMQAGSLQALVVPEPATLGLVGVGLGFLGFGALRRKRVA